MKALDMFKELGYKIAVKDKDVLMYSKDVSGKTIFIHFRLKYRPISEEHLGYGGYVSYDSGSKVQRTFTPKEHQAIHQQMKELGWI